MTGPRHDTKGTVRSVRVFSWFGLSVIAIACGSPALAPAPLDTRNDACASCRMIVSDRRTASQLVAPGEEPLFFDDLACLRRYRQEHATRAGAVVYVADHRTGEWVAATRAVFTRTPRVRTAMSGGVIAHATNASRDADPAAAGGAAVAFDEAVGNIGR